MRAAPIALSTPSPPRGVTSMTSAGSTSTVSLPPPCRVFMRLFRKFSSLFSDRSQPAVGLLSAERNQSPANPAALSTPALPRLVLARHEAPPVAEFSPCLSRRQASQRRTLFAHPKARRCSTDGAKRRTNGDLRRRAATRPERLLMVCQRVNESQAPPAIRCEAVAWYPVLPAAGVQPCRPT